MSRSEHELSGSQEISNDVSKVLLQWICFPEKIYLRPPYQVSWDWWRGGHVTRCSTLIGCDYQGKKGDARRHVEARHVEDMSILCSHCAKPFKTRESLRKHVERTHRIINWIKTGNWVWFNPRLWWRYNLMASIVVKWMNNCAASHSRIPNYLDNRSRVKQWWYKSTKSFKNLIMPWNHESLLQVCDDLQIQSLRRRECASIQSQSSVATDTQCGLAVSWLVVRRGTAAENIQNIICLYFKVTCIPALILF